MEYENTNHDYTDTGVHLWDITDEEIYTDSDLVHLAMTVEEAEALLSTPNNDTTVADVLTGCAAAIC